MHVRSISPHIQVSIQESVLPALEGGVHTSDLDEMSEQRIDNPLSVFIHAEEEEDENKLFEEVLGWDLCGLLEKISFWYVAENSMY